MLGAGSLIGGGQDMIGEQQRRVEVECRVRKELERVGLYRLPVNPVRVANRLGIEVSAATFGKSPISGMVETKGGDAEIFVLESESPYRKKVTVAHELGHYFLHLMEDGAIKNGRIQDRPIDLFWSKEPVTSVSDDWLREIEANWFATELMMPLEFVREEWNRNPSIQSLARIFVVTEEAIGYRVADLNLWIPAESRL